MATGESSVRSFRAHGYVVRDKKLSHILGGGGAVRKKPNKKKKHRKPNFYTSLANVPPPLKTR